MYEKYGGKEQFFARLLTYINSSHSYVSHSGITITKLEENYCEGELTITPEVCNFLGIVHGGCLATLADTVGGLAAVTCGRGTVTLNYGFSFHRQAKGTRIRCVAQPEKIGKTVSVFRCTLTDDEDNLVASGQFTFYMLGPLEHEF